MSGKTIKCLAALVLSVLAMTTMAHAGCGRAASISTAAGDSAKASTIDATIDLLSTIKDLEAKVDQLSELASSEEARRESSAVQDQTASEAAPVDTGSDQPEFWRRKIMDLLKSINAQADRIEAQIPEIKSGYASPEVNEKIDHLKQYVDNLRAKAQKAAQPVI